MNRFKRSLFSFWTWFKNLLKQEKIDNNLTEIPPKAYKSRAEILDGINENYFSPYRIFIKSGSELTDDEILNHLGIKDYKLETEKPDWKSRYLFLSENDGWVHLMDDWSYSLWHNKTIRNNIQSLSQRFEIFTCSIGDIDNSFDFTYLKNGEIIRQYIAEDPNFKKLVIVKNIGKPFPIETEALKLKDTAKKVTMIAKHLGLNLNYTKDQMRVYKLMNKAAEKFNFDYPY